METNHKEKMRYEEAQKRVRQIKGFYVHLIIYLFINAAIIIFNLQNHQFTFGKDFWVLFATPFFWGIGLLIHWVRVFGPNFIFGKKWEERKIKELMDKERHLWK